MKTLLDWMKVEGCYTLETVQIRDAFKEYLYATYFLLIQFVSYKTECI